MASTVAAGFDNGNVTPLWKDRRFISVRPIEYVGSSAYRSRRLKRTKRTEPSTSIGKRLFDMAIASAILLFLVPLLIAVAIAIKVTSPGPVLFHQYRYGYRNRFFKIYKFRSMRTDVCDVAGVKQNEYRAIPGSRRSAEYCEKPVLMRFRSYSTSSGAICLWSGPGRHVPGMLAANVPYEDLVPYYFQRHTARPGITGLAQVSGCRGSTVEPARAISRIDYDLDYIEKWSLLMDIVIIARTVRREFLSGSGF